MGALKNILESQQISDLSCNYDRMLPALDQGQR